MRLDDRKRVGRSWAYNYYYVISATIAPSLSTSQGNRLRSRFDTLRRED